MPGRPPWSQPGTKGSGDPVAVNSRPEIEILEGNIGSGDVAVDAAETTEIYAAAGKVISPVALYARVNTDPDAGSGSHQLRVQQGSKTNVIFGDSSYDQNVWWERSHWFTATNEGHPSNEAAALAAITQLRATEQHPLKLTYKNKTDVVHEIDQAGRAYEMTVEVNQY